MSCNYRGDNFLESDKSFATSLHLISLFEAPILIFGIYIIWKKTPKLMEKVKFPIIVLHLICTWGDIFVSVLSTPVFLFPVTAGYPLGVLYYVMPTWLLCYLGYATLGHSLRSKFSKNRSEYVDRLKKELKHVEKAWLSFDGWEAKYMDKSIYAIFIYYVENFQRKSALLGIECVEGSATAANVGKLVMRMLDLYCIDKSKVLGAVTDAGSNIVAFLDRNELFHSHCSAHVLSLIIKKSAQITHIKELIAKVNRCAAFLSRSKVERGKFRERSSMLNIHGRPPLPFSDTRWGGALLLAEAFLNHYQSLSATPALQDYLMNADDLAALKKYVNVMKPFLEALNSAESDNSFCSEVLVQFSHLSNYASSLEQRSALGRCLSNETKSRYDSYVENDALLMSTYLDARFAYLPGILQRTRWEFIENSIQLYCDSIHVLNQTATGPPPKKPTLEESSFSQFVQSKRVSSHGSSVQAEMSNYKAIVLSGRPALDSSPLLFWHAHRDRFPILQKMGQHFLACTQSSAIVERLFSVCGCIVNNSRRNRMKSSTLNLHLLNASLATLQAKNEAGEMNEYDECEQSDSESEENRHEEISGEFNDDIFEEALARAMTI
ncbi:hypothetical protein B9Z55_021315 [Caenorhabditis nigoni]|uniref:HAT C-terminal dimerisation domain-containing protein n=2 Tax=Caenorhabditis nigoni TaxID=1611254 RepID=A0A2G5TRG1_9PELO|nr:hypothetical protein B9Z55_021315 [Caenorhabditis nigoni]